MSAPLTIVNPSERTWTRHRYVLWFGACAPTYLMVYADGPDDALEKCADWLADNEPGLIMLEGHGNDARDPELDELLEEACREQGLEWPIPDDAWGTSDMEPYWDAEQTAYADLTHTERGYLTSYEWGIELEDPSRDEIKGFIAELAERHYSDTPVVAVA